VKKNQIDPVTGLAFPAEADALKLDNGRDVDDSKSPIAIPDDKTDDAPAITVSDETTGTVRPKPWFSPQYPAGQQPTHVSITNTASWRRGELAACVSGFIDGAPSMMAGVIRSMHERDAINDAEYLYAAVSLAWSCTDGTCDNPWEPKILDVLRSWGFDDIADFMEVDPTAGRGYYEAGFKSLNYDAAEGDAEADKWYARFNAPILVDGEQRTIYSLLGSGPQPEYVEDRERAVDMLLAATELYMKLEAVGLPLIRQKVPAFNVGLVAGSTPEPIGFFIRAGDRVYFSPEPVQTKPLRSGMVVLARVHIGDNRPSIITAMVLEQDGELCIQTARRVIFLREIDVLARMVVLHMRNESTVFSSLHPDGVIVTQGRVTLASDSTGVKA